MSWANWLQLAVLVGALFVTTPLLGIYMARVLGGGPAPGDRFFLPIERAIYRVIGVDPNREQPWNVYALSLLAFSAVSVIGLYLLQRIQGSLPLNPTDVAGSAACPRLQHRLELRDEHELAELRGRVDDEPSDPDGGAHRAELRLRRCRNRRRRCACSGSRPPPLEHDRELLGRLDSVDDPRAAAALRGVRAHPRQPRRRPVAARKRRGRDGRRRRPRRSGAARSGARRRSRSSARMAAARRTRTPLTRSRTRLRSRTCSRSSRSLRFRSP